MNVTINLPAPMRHVSLIMLALGTIWPDATCGSGGAMHLPDTLPPIRGIVARLRELADQLEADADDYDMEAS